MNIIDSNMRHKYYFFLVIIALSILGEGGGGRRNVFITMRVGLKWLSSQRLHLADHNEGLAVAFDQSQTS